MRNPYRKIGELYRDDFNTKCKAFPGLYLSYLYYSAEELTAEARRFRVKYSGRDGKTERLQETQTNVSSKECSHYQALHCRG